MDACHVNPDALSTPSSAFVGRMSKLKTAAPRPTAVRCFSPHRNCLWAAKATSGCLLSVEAKLLREKFPNVDVDAVVEHDPELLVLPGLDDAVQELLSLWTAEAFALSDVDNDFFGRVGVAFACVFLSGGALPEMYS